MSTSDFPRDAIADILSAIHAKNYDRLLERINLTEFVNVEYNEVIDYLAEHCAEFHEKYPDDLLFQFGGEAIRNYNAQHRLVHVGFIFAVINNYFYREIKAPEKFSDDPIGFCTFHLDRLIKALSAKTSGGKIDGDHAILTIDVTAGGEYRKLIGHVTLKVEMILSDGLWYVSRIDNVDEVVPHLVDIGEQVWPHEWDRGIQV